MGARADRFPLFDSMRALAALAVLATHASFSAGLSNDPGSTLREYTARLDGGVAVFFLISGFLLYRPFAKARLEEAASPETRAYAWRRFLRIVPAYWVALTVLALFIRADDILEPAVAPIYYGFGQVYDPDRIATGIHAAWSLCVEVSFYAMLPVFALAMRAVPGSTRARRLRQEAVGVAALFAASLVYKLLTTGPGDPVGVGIFILPAFLDWFALGMGLAVLSLWLSDRPWPAPVRLIERWPGLCWLVAAVAFWVVCTQIGLTGLVGERRDRSQYFAQHYLLAATALFLLLPAVFGSAQRGLVTRLLANRFLAWLGLISYSIFLWNPAVFELMTRWKLIDYGESLVFEKTLALGLALTIPAAALSYYLVERPSLSLRRLVPDRSRASIGEATADTAPALGVPATGHPAD